MMFFLHQVLLSSTESLHQTTVVCVVFFHVTCCQTVCPQVIQKDLEDCEAQITAMETLVSSSQSNKTQFERLCADWEHLHKAVTVRQKRALKMILNQFYCYSLTKHLPISCSN